MAFPGTFKTRSPLPKASSTIASVTMGLPLPAQGLDGPGFEPLAASRPKTVLASWDAGTTLAPCMERAERWRLKSIALGERSSLSESAPS